MLDLPIHLVSGIRLPTIMLLKNSLLAGVKLTAPSEKITHIFPCNVGKSNVKILWVGSAGGELGRMEKQGESVVFRYPGPNRGTLWPKVKWVKALHFSRLAFKNVIKVNV